MSVAVLSFLLLKLATKWTPNLCLQYSHRRRVRSLRGEGISYCTNNSTPSALSGGVLCINIADMQEPTGSSCDDVQTWHKALGVHA